MPMGSDETTPEEGIGPDATLLLVDDDKPS